MKKLASQDLTVFEILLKRVFIICLCANETNLFFYYCNDTQFIKFLMKILISHYLIAPSFSAFNIF